MTRSNTSDMADPTAVIIDIVARLDSTIDHAELATVIATLVPQQARRRTLVNQLDTWPDLLTGAGAHGSPAVIKLIEALNARGVVGIVVPPCPFCHRRVPLTRGRDGLRCCKRCWGEAHAKSCARCGQIGMNERRTAEGESLCAACCRTDPNLLEKCSSCGRPDIPVRRDGDVVLCKACCTPPLAICSVCGQRKACRHADTDAPRCKNCTDKQRTHVCSDCGRDRPVCRRTDESKPLCRECAYKNVCTGCQCIMPIRARTKTGILCQTCYKRNPASQRPCVRCGTVENLYRSKLCSACAWPDVLRRLLTPAGSTMRPDIEPLVTALSTIDPRTGLNWVARTQTQKVLAGLADTPGPVSHELLDQLTPAGAVEHLRTILIDRAVLPARDELLITLERAVSDRVARVADPAERKILRNFATWHHLRRLRMIADRRRLTRDQVAYACNSLTAAANLLAWLRSRGQCLATCTQDDIDEWLTSDTFSRARGFVTWAVRGGHAPRGIEIPRFTNEPTREVFSEPDRRWSLVRWLLHDDTIAIADRVAGLLVLLYGQRVTTITHLTTKQVTHNDDSVQLLLGGRPITVPDFFGSLIKELIADRPARLAEDHDDGAWLFAGTRREQPLQPRVLLRRLSTIGIPATIGRNTALMELAGEMPAAVISGLLGISIDRATRWTQDTGNTRPGYAVALSQRNQAR